AVCAWPDAPCQFARPALYSLFSPSMASIIDRIRSLGSSLASGFTHALTSISEGVARSVASAGERVERHNLIVRSERGWLQQRPATGRPRREKPHGVGERAFSSMMRGAGGIWGPGAWSQDRVRQVAEYRRWVHVACTRICDKVESLAPRVALVHADGIGGGGEQGHRKPITKAMRKRLKRRKRINSVLREHRYKKSLHAIKP